MESVHPRDVRARGEPHGEGRSFSKAAGDVDRAAVNRDEFANKSKADAGAFMRARRGPVDAVKAVEDAAEILRRNADTRVSHASSSCVSVAESATVMEPWK